MPDEGAFLLVIVYRNSDGRTAVQEFNAESYAAAEGMVAFFSQTFPGCRLIGCVITPRQQ